MVLNEVCHPAAAERLGARIKGLRGYKSLLARTERSINPSYPLYEADPVADSLDDIRIILSVVGELFAATGGAGTRSVLPESIRRALDMLEHSFTENIPLDNLARHCGTSKYHLCRLFKKYTGHTIVNHITHVRLNRAMSLLRSGGKNVSEVAFACGFNSLQFFSRTFKKHTGRSPRRWLESERQPG